MFISHVNHITLAVTNIDRSFQFYREVLELKPLVKWDSGAYFLVGNTCSNEAFWFCLNVDKKWLPSACYTHYAFGVDQASFKILSKKIIHSGAEIFKENTSPGDSLYFLDPDGHKLEIHSGNWQKRIEAKKHDLGSWKNVEWFIDGASQ